MISNYSSPALRILLVEDHTDTRRVMARLLENCGFVVVDAASLTDAKRAVVDQDHFNLLVSDVGLPDGTGIELMQWLRRKTPGLPGIALTAYNSAQDKRDAETAGFATHLTKPISLDTFLEAVRRYASPLQH